MTRTHTTARGAESTRLARTLPSRVAPFLVLAAGALLLPAPPILPVSVMSLLSVGAAPLAAQTVELRWTFEPGTVLVYRQTQHTSSAMPMGEMTQSQRAILRQEVLSVGPGGEAEVRVTHASLAIEESGPMGRQTWDSEGGEEPANPGMAMAAMLVGRSFDMTMTADGRVLRVAGVEDMLDEMLAEVSVDPAMAGQARGMMESMFGEEGLASMMQQSMQPLPLGPVAPGHEWDSSLSINMLFGTMRSEYRYVLREVTTEEGSRVAKIDMTGSMGLLDPDPSNPMAGMMEISGGEFSGEFTFDLDRGLLLRSTGSSVMTMTMMQQSVAVTSTHEMELVDGA